MSTETTSETSTTAHPTTSLTPTTTQATSAINTTIVTSTTLSPSTPWLNKSTFSSTSFTSATNITTTDPNSKSSGDVAIICGVVFGVLGLAIALVACYIIVRKIKENKEKNRKNLEYKNSERKPYDSVQKDFDSDHNYKEISSDKAVTNIDASETLEDNRKIHDGNYENINNSAQSEYFNMHPKVDATIDTYETVTNPDRRSQIYIEMSHEPKSSRQNSSVDAKVPATSSTGNSSKENLSFEIPSYANLNSVNAENSAKKNDQSDYANGPSTLANGQNRLSLKTEETSKTKKPKSSKKKNTYDINSGSVADLDDITYKL